MVNIVCVGCLGLSPVKYASQFEIAKNLTKPPILGVKSRSRSLMLIPRESSSAVLVVISNNSMPFCNRSHARQVNNGKITIS